MSNAICRVKVEMCSPEQFNTTVRTYVLSDSTGCLGVGLVRFPRLHLPTPDTGHLVHSQVVVEVDRGECVHHNVVHELQVFPLSMQ